MHLHQYLAFQARALLFMWAIAIPQATYAQAVGTTPPLAIRTTEVPKAFVRQPYQFPLQAQGGTAPLSWTLTDGSLPKGITLHDDGTLNGSATETGEFRFTVTVTDSGKPAYQRQQRLSLLVVAPLLAQWGRPPGVNGQRIEGSILVSNQTEEDFDLTAIVLAVNEIGRATAIGYQHFLLKKDSIQVEIPFGENLASGNYELNVDVVAEVPAKNAIHRVRLAPTGLLRVEQAP